MKTANETQRTCILIQFAQKQKVGMSCQVYAACWACDYNKAVTDMTARNAYQKKLLKPSKKHFASKKRRSLVLRLVASTMRIRAAKLATSHNHDRA